jgi:hypothetical protein
LSVRLGHCRLMLKRCLRLSTAAFVAAAGLAWSSPAWAVSPIVSGTLSAAATTCTASGPSCLFDYPFATDSMVTINVAGNASGASVVFEVSGDGVNFVQQPVFVAPATSVAGPLASVSAITSTGVYQAPVLGYLAVRLRVASITSGSYSVTLTLSSTPTYFTGGSTGLKTDSQGRIIISPTGGVASGAYTNPPSAVTSGTSVSLATNQFGQALYTQSGLNIWDLMTTTGVPGGPAVTSGTCINIKTSPGKLGYIWVAGSTSALTYTITIFDDAGTTCSTTGTSATSYPLWTSGSTIAAGQIFALDIPVTRNGLAYTITGSINQATPVYISYL